MTVTINQELTETAYYRCEVTMEDSEGQTVLSENKLIYAQKIAVGYSSGDFDHIANDKYYITADNESEVRVSIYGDDAYPITTDSTCQFTASVSKTISFGEDQKYVEVPVPDTTTSPASITCELKFQGTTLEESPLSVTILPEKIIVADKCGVDEHFNEKSGTCQSCGENGYRGSNDKQYLGCIQCPAGKEPNTDHSGCVPCAKGKYSQGFSNCTDCPAGTYSNSPGASICTLCPAGTASKIAGRDAVCEACGDGKYAPAVGMTECLTCAGISTDRSSCEQCEAGWRYDAGDRTCVEFTCSPGQTLQDGDSCKDCPAGTKQPLSSNTAECIPCDPDLGEYQPSTASTNCLVTRPGYSLNSEADTTADQEKCAKNTYSQGGARECSPCDAQQNEYTEGEGASYCSICRGNLDSAGNCEVTNCTSSTIELIGIGNETFTFPTTSPGVTATLRCNSDNNQTEYIRRYCKYDETTRGGVWLQEDTSDCSSAFSESVNQATEDLKNTDFTNPNEAVISTEAIKKLTVANATKMSAKDFTTIAQSLDTITETIGDTEAEVELDIAAAGNLADTVSAVGKDGASKMHSVTANDKEKMVSCMTTIASHITEDVAVESPSVALKKFSSVESGKTVDLPAPTEETVSAPKLKMNKSPANPPSVAVFAKSTASVIFPEPGEVAVESTGVKHASSISLSLDSAVVSLEFPESDELDFQIDIAVDTSNDTQYPAGVILERICKFYDEAAKDWSTDRCSTEMSTSSEQIVTYQCSCTHNTSFAIILSATEVSDTSQSDATKVLMPINIIFLFATFMCLVPFEKIRSRTLVQIQTQICLMSFFGHVLFLIVGELSPESPGCTPGVILTQYFFLGSVSWSVCAAVTLFDKIVNALKSYGKQDKHYFLKCLVGCWVCPAFMVLATYITAWKMGVEEMPYLAQTGVLDGDEVQICWVEMPWKLVGFMIPIFLCLLLNLVLFVMTARIVVRAGKNGSNAGSAGHTREVKALLSIATTVGLPWLVIVFAHEGAAVFCQWLFIILVSLQGPTMFVCFVVLQEDVVTCLFDVFGRKPPAMLLNSSSKSGHASSEMSTLRPTSGNAEKRVSRISRVARSLVAENPFRSSDNKRVAAEKTTTRLQQDNVYETVDSSATSSGGGVRQNMGPHVPQLV